MRTFVLYSRKGVTVPWHGKAIDAGRMDVVSDCARAALLLSREVRKDARFYACLNGPPEPPKCVEVNGEEWVPIDAEGMDNLLKKKLKFAARISFQELLKGLKGDFYIVDERGEEMEIESKNPIFIIGDHIGLPKSDEKFIKRFNAKKISLGKKRYFAKDVITVLNYTCDRS